MRPTIPIKSGDAKSKMYERYCRAQSAEWGNSVAFWIRDNNPKEAGRKARFAARWALKILGRQE